MEVPDLARFDVDISCWAGDVGAPMMLVHRVLLVEIELEGLIVSGTFEVLVPEHHGLI